MTDVKFESKHVLYEDAKLSGTKNLKDIFTLTRQPSITRTSDGHSTDSSMI